MMDLHLKYSGFLPTPLQKDTSKTNISVSQDESMKQKEKLPRPDAENKIMMKAEISKNSIPIVTKEDNKKSKIASFLPPIK
jgi:hypothetical protein